MTSRNSSDTAILIAGCGDVGTALGQQLSAQGHQVYGLKRTINQLPDSIQGIRADLSKPETLQQLPAVDILVFSAAANEASEAGYRTVYLEGLQSLIKALPQPPKHVFFTSSTAVYHQDDHDWVNEQSPCEPQRYNGQVMLDAENWLLSQSTPATTVRFSGIYGPGRNRLLKMVSSGKGAAARPQSYSNRIHRDDCVGVLNHLIQRVLSQQPVAPIYLASDDAPVPLHQVTQWLATQLDVSIKDESLGRFAGSKRCNNQLLKETGYQFIYPSFTDGYQQLLQDYQHS